MTFKDHRYVKINSVNHLYLIINKINVCIEVSNRNKTLTLVPTDDSKEILKNMKNSEVKPEILLV